MCINDDRLRTDHPSEARTLTSDFMLLNIQFYEWYFVYQFVVVDILSFFFLVTVLSALLFGHCIVCPSFWSLYCLPFSDIRLLITCTPLESSNISQSLRINDL